MKLYISLLCLCLSIVVARIEYATYAPEPTKRVTLHEPKIIDKTCRLEPERGPCRGNIEMYYFDPEHMNCSRFRWGGCQGNGNRFDNEKECNTTCMSQPDQKLPRPRYCELAFDYGYCFGAFERYYYDKNWKVCKETIYSGCGGNKNNFYSLENCESICRFNIPILRTKRKKKDGIKKYLVVNPWNATKHRGLYQPTTRTTVEEIRWYTRRNNSGYNFFYYKNDWLPRTRPTSNPIISEKHVQVFT